MKGTGTLFVVATPIGNLEDITLRALRVLKEVTIVAAEDTRRTANLLRHYQIGTPLVSLHEHNEHRRQVELVRRLVAGDTVALVSDAGTPGISDPGAHLVRAAREAGIRVEPIPGASAVTAILSASGLALDRFAFAGFPPTASKERRKWFDWLARQDVAVVCFEAPHRIARTLKEMAINLGNRPIIIARELTKVHEQWISASVKEAAEAVRETRGEFVFVIGSSVEPLLPAELPSDDAIASLFGQITDISQGSRREAIKATASTLGISAKAVFAALERSKISVE